MTMPCDLTTPLKWEDKDWTSEATRSSRGLRHANLRIHEFGYAHSLSSSSCWSYHPVSCV